MAERKPGRQRWRLLLLPPLLCCGCLTTETSANRPSKMWTAGWWTSRTRHRDVLATKPVPDALAAEDRRQPDSAQANSGEDSPSNDKAAPPVVSTQTAATEETAAVTPTKAEGPPNKPEAATDSLSAPLPLPSPPSREASPPPPSTARPQPVPPRLGAAPGMPGPGGQPGQPTPITDPHQRLAPTATGALLNVPPGESIAERALDLGVRLAATEADRKALEARVAQLTATLQSREQDLQAASKEVQEATDEVIATRKQLQVWRQDDEETRIRSQKQKREDLEKLKALITLMEKVLDNSPSSGTADKETRRQGDKETPGQSRKDQHDEH